MIGAKEHKLSNFDTRKNEIREELGNVKHNDFEDLVYRMQLTHDEIIDTLDLKYIRTKRTSFSLNPVFFEVIDLSNTWKYILPDIVKLRVTIDDVRLKSNLKTSQTLIFTEKSFS